MTQSPSLLRTAWPSFSGCNIPVITLVLCTFPRWAYGSRQAGRQNSAELGMSNVVWTPACFSKQAKVENWGQQRRQQRYAALKLEDWTHVYTFTCVQCFHNASLNKFGSGSADRITTHCQNVLRVFTLTLAYCLALPDRKSTTKNTFKRQV